MDKSINQRFTKILDEKKISQADFADKIKTGRANVNNWCRLKNAIPLDTIVELLIMYPDIDARWLLTGSPREYNIDHPITMVEEKTATFISGDKDYIIQLQKELINNLKKDNARLTQDIAGDSLPKRDIAV